MKRPVALLTYLFLGFSTAHAGTLDADKDGCWVPANSQCLSRDLTSEEGVTLKNNCGGRVYVRICGDYTPLGVMTGEGHCRYTYIRPGDSKWLPKFNPTKTTVTVVGSKSYSQDETCFSRFAASPADVDADDRRYAANAEADGRRYAANANADDRRHAADADEDGCWSPDNLQCLSGVNKDVGWAHVLFLTNNCGARIYTKFCSELVEGGKHKDRCGASGIPAGKRHEWIEPKRANPTGRHKWTFVGSNIPDKDWVCAGKADHWDKLEDDRRYAANAEAGDRRHAANAEAGDRRHAASADADDHRHAHDADEDGCWFPKTHELQCLSGVNKDVGWAHVLWLTNNCGGPIYAKFCSEQVKGIEYSESCGAARIGDGKKHDWVESKGTDTSPWPKPTGKHKWTFVGSNISSKDWVCAGKSDRWDELEDTPY